MIKFSRENGLARHPNSERNVSARLAARIIPRQYVWAMLFSRIALFAAWQSVFAFGFFLGGSRRPWAASVAWWLLSASLANATNIGLLTWLARWEGLRLSSLFNFKRQTWRLDIPIAIAAVAVSAPLGYFPSGILARTLIGSIRAVLPMMFHPLPKWAIAVAIAVFPVTIALSELPNYCGYVLPRLKAQTGAGWKMVVLVGLTLAFQHVALPLQFDLRFMLWRLGMFIPFAIFVVAVVNWRPSLLPYLMIVQGLLDAQLPLLVPTV